MRDDFTNETKLQLAKRVGYLCSYPGCGNLTIGPSEESDTSTSSIGTACHISAASMGPGARRYNPVLTSEQRKDISNGIWMCTKHGKLIDTDENRFSIKILKSWKKLAEEIAALMVIKGYEYIKALNYLENKTFAENSITISELGVENESIGNLINDSCINIIWGKSLGDAVRDYIIEHYRNAFLHGKASELSIDICDNIVTITDNGNEFNSQILAKNSKQRGGTIAVKNLLKYHNKNVVYTHLRDKEKNITKISMLKNAEDILSLTPCSVQLNFMEFHKGNSSITISKNCHEFFVALPPFFALSDVMMMNERFPQFLNLGDSLIFIVENASYGVMELLTRNFLNCKIIELDK